MRPEREADHSLQSNAKFYACVPFLHLHDVVLSYGDVTVGIPYYFSFREFFFSGFSCSSWIMIFTSKHARPLKSLQNQLISITSVLLSMKSDILLVVAMPLRYCIRCTDIICIFPKGLSWFQDIRTLVSLELMSPTSEVCTIVMWRSPIRLHAWSLMNWAQGRLYYATVIHQMLLF
jgi:hypothetical protein